MEGNVRKSRADPKVNPSAETREGDPQVKEKGMRGRVQELGLVWPVQAAAV